VIDGLKVIVCGLFVRISVVLLLTTYFGIYTLKERAFTQSYRVPKATVQAALASVVLLEAIREGN